MAKIQIVEHPEYTPDRKDRLARRYRFSSEWGTATVEQNTFTLAPHQGTLKEIPYFQSLDLLLSDGGNPIEYLWETFSGSDLPSGEADTKLINAVPVVNLAEESTALNQESDSTTVAGAEY